MPRWSGSWLTSSLMEMPASVPLMLMLVPQQHPWVQQRAGLQARTSSALSVTSFSPVHIPAVQFSLIPTSLQTPYPLARLQFILILTAAGIAALPQARGATGPNSGEQPRRRKTHQKTQLQRQWWHQGGVTQVYHDLCRRTTCCRQGRCAGQGGSWSVVTLFLCSGKRAEFKSCATCRCSNYG